MPEQTVIKISDGGLGPYYYMVDYYETRGDLPERYTRLAVINGSSTTSKLMKRDQVKSLIDALQWHYDNDGMKPVELTQHEFDLMMEFGHKYSCVGPWRIL